MKNMIKNKSRKRPPAQRQWVSFKPELDTWIALASVPAMTMLYYLNTHYGFEHPAVFFIGFVFLGHLLLNTVLPVYVVLVMRGEGLSELGFTKNKLLTSFIISALLVASIYPSLIAVLKSFEGNPAPNIAYNAIALWEPLFVFGWLQLRFERAFGIIAGGLMASFGFMSYHIGSFPPDMLIVLFMTGAFYGAIFAYVRNLCVLIPITWAAASTMGTIQGGYIFDWLTVSIYVVVLVLQILILWYFSKRAFKGLNSVSIQNEFVKGV